MIIKNFIKSNSIKKRSTKNLSYRLKKIFENILLDVDRSNKTLNVLSKEFNFSFSFKDLKSFKKFKTIAIIGMGGSILGTEAIYNFLEKKNK